MSTLTGHSLLQALQERQRSSASFTASLCQRSGRSRPRAFPIAGVRGRGWSAFLPRGHVAGAHGSGVGFAACSYADATQRCFRERAFVFGEFEVGFSWWGLYPAPSRRFSWAVDGGAGRACRGSCGWSGSRCLEFAEGLDELGAKHFGSSAERDCPSPCSPEKEPPWATTISAA